MKLNLVDKIFKISIIVLIFYKSLQLVIRIYNIVIIEIVLNGNESCKSKFPFIVDEIKFENRVNYIIVISFFVFLSTWLFIRYKAAHKVANYKLSYKPIWALFAFIIPVFNLFAPYRIMNDLWTVNNKNMALEKAGKRLINIWWSLSIIIFIVYRFIAYKSDSVENMSEFLKLECY